jgi:predicted  nucleic acid-binding Zn-ribbon protein
MLFRALLFLAPLHNLYSELKEMKRIMADTNERIIALDAKLTEGLTDLQADVAFLKEQAAGLNDDAKAALDRIEAKTQALVDLGAQTDSTGGQPPVEPSLEG